MSQKELPRMKVVENAVQGRLSVSEAAELPQLSSRQVKKLKRSYDAADPGWVHHGNRSRRPGHAIPENVRSRVIDSSSRR